MLLRKIRISNFKSIVDSDWIEVSKDNNITILAGQNESGKSAVLEAVDFLFNNPSPDFERLQKRLDTDITEVQAELNLTEQETQKLSEQFPEEPNISKIKVIIYSKTHNKDNTVATKLVINDDEFQLGDVVRNEINNFLPIVSLYTTFKDLLPSQVTTEQIPNDPAVKDFERVFGVNLAEFMSLTDPRKIVTKREEIEGKANDDFNESWTQKIESLKSKEEKYKFNLLVDTQEPKKLTFMIKGNDQKPLYLEQKSMGFRWFSAFHLRLRALGNLSNLNDGSYSKNIIILIDEPGQNLHDTAQKDVKRIIEETADKGIQVIYSTHNPRLIVSPDSSKIEMNRIRLTAKNTDGVTKVYTIPQFLSSRKGQIVIDTLAPLRIALGLASVSPLLDLNKRNIVVEGITDHYYMNAMKELLGENTELAFIPSCGVDNVVNVVSLLIGWGAKYKAVFDDDASQGRKAYNKMKKAFFEGDDKLAHKYIYKIEECHGIEDVFTQTDFAKLTKLFLNIDIDTSKSNSENASTYGKEVIARMFWEYSQKKTESIKLSKDTNDNWKKIFEWISK